MSNIKVYLQSHTIHPLNYISIGFVQILKKMRLISSQTTCRCWVGDWSWMISFKQNWRSDILYHFWSCVISPSVHMVTVDRPNIWSKHCGVLSDHCLALDFKPLVRSRTTCGASGENWSKALNSFDFLIHKWKKTKPKKKYHICFANAPFSCRHKCTWWNATHSQALDDNIQTSSKF